MYIPTNYFSHSIVRNIFFSHLICNRLKSLRTLSIKGNPFCLTDEWKNFTVALLPRLAYLEISSISAEERERGKNNLRRDRCPKM